MTKGPPPSNTRDTASHHTSPTAGNAQKPVTPIANAPRKVSSTGSFKLPPAVTKHPNPVGRPRNRNMS